jgi:hypothetical protein
MLAPVKDGADLAHRFARAQDRLTKMIGWGADGIDLEAEYTDAVDAKLYTKAKDCSRYFWNVISF